MKRMLWLLLAVVLLSACGQTEESQVKTGKETALKSKTIDYKGKTKAQLESYLKAMPAAFNQSKYSKVAKYVKPGSEAEKYLKKKIKSGSMKHYVIEQMNIDQIKVEGNETHAQVTRIMHSDATKGKRVKVVTLFDFVYDKAAKQMLLTDFNDQSVKKMTQKERVTTENATTEKATTEQATTEHSTAESKATGNANECVTSNFKSGCDGVSEAELADAYQQLVAQGQLPAAAATDCIQCAIQESHRIKEGKKEQVETDAPTTNQTIDAATAQQKVEAQYRSDVEDYNSEVKQVNFTVNDHIEQDIGGKYYKVQAVDENNTLLQSFKVYINSGEIVAE